MKISVITPSFNQGKYIERTLLSVLSQEGDFDLEYIVMDGGSTDQTTKILKTIQNKLDKGDLATYCNSVSFSYISEKDKWQSDAINKGLKLATGDILTYLNSDDTYEVWCLQQVATQLWKSDAKWSYGKCKIIDQNDREIRKWITVYKNFLSRKYSYAKLLSENFISQMTVFWKRDIMEEVGYFDENEHLCMDYEYWLRLGKKDRPLYIDQHLANFRFYTDSKSGSSFSQQFKDELRNAKKYADGKYKFALFVHKFNYYKITIIYKVMAFLRI